MGFNELWDKLESFIKETIDSIRRKNSLADLVDNTLTEFEEEYMNGGGRRYDGSDSIDHSLFRQFLKWLRVSFIELANEITENKKAIATHDDRLKILEEFKRVVSIQIQNLFAHKNSSDKRISHLEKCCENADAALNNLRTRIAELERLTSNKSPVVDAGADKTVQLPISSFTLRGVATDPEGDSMTYAWVKVSGGDVLISGTDTLLLKIENLSEGSYLFRLTATDSNGNVGFDDVSLTVEAASDTDAPTGVIAQFPKEATAKDVTLTLELSEEVLRVEGWNKVDSTTYKKIVGVNGDYTASFQDLAGNTGTASHTVSNIDKTAPVVSVDYGDISKLREGDSLIPTVTANDDNSPLKYSWATKSNNVEFSSKVSKQPTITFSGAGEAEITITVTDALGNSVSKARLLNVSAVDKPVTATANWGEVNSTTSAVQPIITGNHSSGVIYAWSCISEHCSQVVFSNMTVANPIIKLPVSTTLTQIKATVQCKVSAVDNPDNYIILTHEYEGAVQSKSSFYFNNIHGGGGAAHSSAELTGLAGETVRIAVTATGLLSGDKVHYLIGDFSGAIEFKDSVPIEENIVLPEGGVQNATLDVIGVAAGGHIIRGSMTIVTPTKGEPIAFHVGQAISGDSPGGINTQ